jgi:zinc ribbon protein
VFCPTCGSNNQDDLKFCTRCGTNLEIVSDALRGRTTGPLVTDERTVSLLKDYYRSRRMLIIGSAASLISLFKLALLMSLGFPEKLLPLTILVGALLLYGAFMLIWGLTKWNNSSSELKALGVSPLNRKTLSAQKSNLLPPTQLSIEAKDLATGLIPTPSSVTEGTTNLLDDPKPMSPSRNVP